VSKSRPSKGFDNALGESCLSMDSRGGTTWIANVGETSVWRSTGMRGVGGASSFIFGEDRSARERRLDDIDTDDFVREMVREVLGLL